MGKINERLKHLNIELPEVPEPAAIYVPTKRFGDNLIYVSGQDCRKNGKLLYEGKVGKDLTIDQGKKASEQAMINTLAALKTEIGDLDKIKSFVKILGFVNSAEGFVEQPYVIDGASQLLEKIFKEKGQHARSALSANELPFNTPIEIETIVELKEIE